MSAMSPLTSTSPLSPVTFRRIKGLYESIKEIDTVPLTSCRIVPLNLPPTRLTDSAYQSIQCYFKDRSEEKRKPACILYKVTSLSNFIDFIFALHTMKPNEVSHVITLDLSYFTHVEPPHGFEKFYNLLQQKCPHIREIIWANHLPVDEKFFEFLKGFANLTRLNLSGCSDKIKDEYLKRLVLSHPKIADLNLSGCDQITNKGIQYLPLLYDLEKLNLSYLDKVTDASLVAMKLLKRIRYIDLFNTGISNDCVRQLKMEEKNKDLKVQFDDEIILIDSSADIFGLSK